MKRGEKAGPGFFRVLLKPESQHDSRWNNFTQASIALKRLDLVLSRVAFKYLTQLGIVSIVLLIFPL